VKLWKRKIGPTKREERDKEEEENRNKKQKGRKEMKRKRTTKATKKEEKDEKEKQHEKQFEGVSLLQSSPCKPTIVVEVCHHCHCKPTILVEVCHHRHKLLPIPKDNLSSMIYLSFNGLFGPKRT
jgi:archaellum component FlaD/FlaE